MLEGSYGSTLAVRTVERGFVEIAGSPAKWLQGHNLYGSDDLPGLVLAVLDRVVSSTGVAASPVDRAAWLRGDVELSRVDVNYSWHVEGGLDGVLAWLRAASEGSSVKWRGRGHFQEGTLTFGYVATGKRASPWQMTLYAKGQEIRLPGHGLSPYIERAPDLFEWAQDKLRIELRLRGGELKRARARTVSDWNRFTASRLHAVYLSKLELSTQQMTKTDAELDLKPRHRAALALWRTGQDLKAVYPRPTFYRLRKELIDAADVDIAARAAAGNVVPLVRTLEAVPAQLPSWGGECLFTPSRRLRAA